MTANEMKRIFSAAALVADADGKTPACRLRSLLQDEKKPLHRLLAAWTEKPLYEVGKSEAPEMLLALVRLIHAGGAVLLNMISKCTAEKVCTLLYQYQPEDIDALYFLMKQRCKDDVCTMYQADALRLLVMSKLEKGANYPSLRDLLMENRANDVNQTGDEIISDIFAAIGIGGENDDH